MDTSLLYSFTNFSSTTIVPIPRVTLLVEGRDWGNKGKFGPFQLFEYGFMCLATYSLYLSAFLTPSRSVVFLRSIIPCFVVGVFEALFFAGDF